MSNAETGLWQRYFFRRERRFRFIYAKNSAFNMINRSMQT